ncbi:MAG: putative CheW-like signal transduction protein [Nitrospira sp.]|jgi:chemotaxis signal transduction protein|nr:putative CheW-like signal transduction protein [Nitrospira sp.]
MLRAQLRRQSQVEVETAAMARMQGMVVFSVGGRRLAAAIEEIGGIIPWPEAILVPSDTPFVTRLVRQGKSCLPVFDLAAKFSCAIRDNDALCLIIKHADGPMAICVDSHVPSLHMVARSAVHYRVDSDPDIAGTCIVGDEEFPIIHLRTLGISSIRTH